MKYLIEKGYRGFGDRLTHLIYCVKIALQTNRKIYVDWNDEYWNHNGENFYTYFELLNIGITDISHLNDLSCSPKYWKNRLDTVLKLSDFPEVIKQEQIDKVSLITKKFPTEDVLVIINYFRKAYTDISFFPKIFRVKDNRVLSSVKELQSRYNLKDCTGVHLRGTDRKMLKSVGNTDILKKLYTKIKPTDKIVCFTDDIELFNEFKRKVPSAILLTKIVMDKPIATHKLLPGEVTYSKDEMNVNLLIDFFSLASCKTRYSTFEESTFFMVSKQIHPYVDIILGNGK